MKKIGKVTKLLQKIKEEKTMDLMSRFKHIVSAQAIRIYIAAKPDPLLDIEVRLTEEELLKNRLK